MNLLGKILVLAILSSGSDSVYTPPEPQVSTTLMAESVRVDDTCEYIINVQFLDNPVNWLWDSLIPPITSGLELVGESRNTTTRRAGDSISGATEITFYFVPQRTGKLTMSEGYFRLFYIYSLDTLATDTSGVDTVIVKYPGFSITGIPPKKPFPDALSLILIVAGIVSIVVIELLLRKWLEQAKSRTYMKEVILSARERANQQLDKLSFIRENSKELLDAIPRILREFIIEEYNISTAGLSSEEIITALEQNGMAGQKLVQVKKILKYCDSVKFAGANPERDELEQIYKMTKEFINS